MFLFAIYTFYFVCFSFQTCQAIICVILGLIFDLNKIEEHKAANVCNDICVLIIILVTVVNLVISGFDLKSSHLMVFRT